ncbi:hypothetical protein ScPMuIL_018100 [Solemya velum]
MSADVQWSILGWIWRNKPDWDIANSSGEITQTSASTDCGSKRKTIAKKLKIFSVLLGGILVHLTLGTVYTFGNITPYFTSYFRARHVDSDLRYADSEWVVSMGAMGQGMSMFLGGFMYRKLGARITVLIGSWLQSLAVFMTYFTVQHSFGATIVVYGLVFGLGCGIAYAVPMAVAMKWLPNHKGLVNGVIVAGFGSGAFIFDQVQTAYINPDNLKPDQTVGSDKYFTQDSVLDKVPTVFLVMGGCYASMQLLGVILLDEPPDQYSERQSSVQSEDATEKEKDPLLSEYDKPQLVDEFADDTEDIIESRNPGDHADTGMSVKDALKSRSFWTLWSIYLFNGQGILFISSLFKAYGQTFINDDLFLSTVGSVSALFNGSGRILWGYIADRFCCKVSLVFQTGTFTFLVLSFGLTSLTGKTLYTIYVCLLFLSFSGNFSLLPTATAKAFGQKNYSIIYGLVFSSSVITSPLAAVLTQTLKGSIGWYGMFFVVSGFSFLSLILGWSFKVKREDGQDV